MSTITHVHLTANGTHIDGEPTESVRGDGNSIEAVFYEDSVASAIEAATANYAGRRKHHPIKIRKRVDMASPILFKALCNNEVIEGEFKFFRPDRDGMGEIEHFYTVSIKKGRIASITVTSPDCLDPDNTSEPATEVVEIVFHTITKTYVADGKEHTDNWAES
ncbi:hypothetical protein PPSIR1_28148 [Plesiocystis pacifica SIR-1]|uniref:Secreted protein Hcp n=1 Tax=Plesiocystis pacifica SIR-1 TaxID=391625 RepID=A6FZQ2_9BACT|nr:type VI secretion system tube protein TssD [Plesiocystis pacifica]EDM80858.1 hypothetical protein PPSIR1_28148 [Plesiocystis pacifica SIR-1]